MGPRLEARLSGGDYWLGLPGGVRNHPSAPFFPESSPNRVTSRHWRSMMLEPDLRTYSQTTVVRGSFELEEADGVAAPAGAPTEGAPTASVDGPAQAFARSRSDARETVRARIIGGSLGEGRRVAKSFCRQAGRPLLDKMALGMEGAPACARLRA